MRRSSGVAGAKVEIAAANMLAVPFAVTADDQGRFHAERSLDPLVICAKNPDGTLGAIVEIGAEDPEVVIAVSPTATATGVLLDEQGKPAANQKLYWGRRVYLDEEQRLSMDCFAPKVVTDGEGKFTLPSLVVGQEYEIAVQRENMLPRGRRGAAREGRARSTWGRSGSGPIKGNAGSAEEMSSFRKNAPGPGAVAPRFRSDHPRRQAAHARATSRGGTSCSTSGPPGAARASARSPISRPSTTPSARTSGSRSSA